MSNLGPFQKKFKTGDIVSISLPIGQDSFCGKGKVLGCSSRGIIDQYIVLLNKQIVVEGERHEAVVFSSHALELIERIEQ